MRCVYCGNVFNTRYSLKKYCSNSCRSKRYYYDHKLERIKYRHDYINKNINKIKKYKQQYRLINKNKIKEYQKEYDKRYYVKNKSKKQLYLNKYLKYRRATDINFKLRYLLSKRIRNALKTQKKSKTVEELCGCNITFLKKYLQKQFKPGMHWKNHGEWHIDHIRPCSSFDLSKESEQRACFHYTNLQPLWAKDNLLKGDKY